MKSTLISSDEVTFVGYDGKTYKIGDRVEIHPGTDLWMSGARYGKVVGSSFFPLERVHVRMDRLPKRLFGGTEDTFRKVRSKQPRPGVSLWFVAIVTAILTLAPVTKAQTPTTNPGVVNINTATAAQLCYLPGVGPKTAAAIIAARPFATPQGITAVRGIKAKRWEAMAPFVTITGPTTAKSKIRTAPAGGGK